jgi:hypothetical protein
MEALATLLSLPNTCFVGVPEFIRYASLGNPSSCLPTLRERCTMSTDYTLQLIGVEDAMVEEALTKFS